MLVHKYNSHISHPIYLMLVHLSLIIVIKVQGLLYFYTVMCLTGCSVILTGAQKVC